MKYLTSWGSGQSEYFIKHKKNSNQTVGQWWLFNFERNFMLDTFPKGIKDTRPKLHSITWNGESVFSFFCMFKKSVYLNWRMKNVAFFFSAEFITQTYRLEALMKRSIAAVLHWSNILERCILSCYMFNQFTWLKILKSLSDGIVWKRAQPKANTHTQTTSMLLSFPLNQEIRRKECS